MSVQTGQGASVVKRKIWKRQDCDKSNTFGSDLETKNWKLWLPRDLFQKKLLNPTIEAIDIYEISFEEMFALLIIGG